MKHIGQQLKEARQAKKIELNEVSLSIKINPKILKAIEEWDEKNLPPRTFLRGFLQAYATFLGLNTSEVMKAFQAEIGSTQPKPVIDPQLAQEPTAESSNSSTAATRSTPKNEPTQDGYDAAAKANNNRKIATIILIAVLLGIIVTLKRKADFEESGKNASSDVTQEATDDATTSPESEPSVEASLTPTTATDSETVASGSIRENQSTPLTSPTPSVTPSVSVSPTRAISPTPSSTPTRPATPSVTASSTPTRATSPTPVPIVAPSVKPTPALTAKPTATPTPTRTVTPTPTPTPTASPSPTATTSPEVKAEAKKEVKREVIIEALGQVTVEVQFNGKSEKLTLSSDDVRTIRSTTPVRLKVSNGGAVNISKNGKDLGSPGNLGQAVEVEY